MSRRGENIYKRKDGRYEGRYIKYYGLSGKAVYGYVYSKSYGDVKEKLVKCKSQKSELKSQNELFGDWLDFWLEKQKSIKITTRKIYKSYIDNHILPKIGNIPLKKLNSDILQKFIGSLNLSPSTVKGIFSIIKSSLSDAEDNGYITNIYGKIKLPKKPKCIVRVLSLKEQKKLEKTLSDTPKDTGILICLYTGLRIGEICALKWSDINFETSVLTVNGTQARTENGLEIIPPKSKTSKREIPVPLFLINKIRALPHSSNFVISKNNKAFDVRTYRRYFKTILNLAKLPDMKFHCLRHTFATRALEVGMDYKTLSEILGHSSVGITLDLYAHSLKEHKIKQMNKLNKIYQ